MNSRLSLGALVLAGLVGTGLGGCGGVSPPPSGFEQSLTRTSGCADVFLIASNADDSLAVVFQASGQVDKARMANKVTTFPIVLPALGVSVNLYQGKGLAASFCTDFIEAGARRIDSDRSATAGTATLVVTPTPNKDNDRASVTLQNLSFQDSSGTPVILPQLQINDIHVGWLAG